MQERHDRDPRTTISAWEQKPPFLEVAWADGHISYFHYRWLRENSFDEHTRDRKSGQKIKPFGEVASDPRPQELALMADGFLQLQWQEDACLSRFDPRWLRWHCSGELQKRRNAAAPVLWAGGAGLAPAATETYLYPQLTTDDAYTYKLLTAFRRWGFARLDQVPNTSGMVLQVAEHFGYVRETNYGKYFDVVTLIDPSHPAYSSIGLAPHSDNNYRYATPSVQILHCLASSARGGESTLVDGFFVADLFRRDHPRLFERLTKIPVAFYYDDDSTSLYHETEVIKVDGRGTITEVHVNERTMAELSIPYSEMPDFYEAYRVFSQYVHDPRWAYEFKMNAGEAIIFDNLRLLHGRTPYENTVGERHLQGCYCDIDGFISRHRVLARTCEASLQK